MKIILAFLWKAGEKNSASGHTSNEQKATDDWSHEA